MLNQLIVIEALSRLDLTTGPDVVEITGDRVSARVHFFRPDSASRTLTLHLHFKR